MYHRRDFVLCNKAVKRGKGEYWEYLDIILNRRELG